MFHRDSRSAWITALVAVVVATLAMWAPSFAAGSGEEDVPSTSIVPADPPSSAEPVSSPGSSTSPSTTSPSGGTWMPPPKHMTPVHHASSKNSVHEPEIEPAQARLKVLEDSPVYAAPAKSSKHIEQLTRDKFVEVTGSTHYFLRVNLKSGQTGYIEPSAVELVKPVDKVFVLTHDAAVLDKPNRWAKKVAEVHASHNVHVVGLSLDYMQIRMKSGLEGFIPMSALQ
ncbi:MAG: SH3 domain-containing protein [Candidatus Binatus sp.]|uniref:SH3 domain-containing protein n=2 Tax=Candidatus Binatus sp. TaxID=2811406 RepID=UPI003BB0E114